MSELHSDNPRDDINEGLNAYYDDIADEMEQTILLIEESMAQD